MMAAPFTAALFISLLTLIASSQQALSPSSLICPFPPYPWLQRLQSLSPPPLNSPVQVDRDSVDQAVAGLESGHIAVLFHASWCPFSREAHPIYETLSRIFPEIEHLTVEQSSATPRYGIHGFPAILIVSNSSSVRYCGPRDLSSLVEFYKKTTAAEPVQYTTSDHLISLSVNNERSGPLIYGDSYLKEMLSREPYLAFSVLFIVLRLLYFTLPGALAFTKSVWQRFVIPRMNWEIFGETSQIFSRAHHMIDVKRFWTKLQVCKTRNFHQLRVCGRLP